MGRMRAVMDATNRVAGGFIAGAPGLVLVVLYGMRLASLRADPAGAPGTPAETAIAVMVAGLAVASFLFARAVLAGRVARPVGVIGVVVLAAGVFGLSFSVAVMT